MIGGWMIFGVSDVWSYRGQRVIVTGGGGSGMGAAVVAELSELGAEIHVLDLREPAPAVAGFHQIDLKDPDAIADAVQSIGGPIDALFNCVGVPGPPVVPALDTMLINFAGVRHLTELATALMPSGGAVASIASAAAAGWQAHLDTFLPLVQTDGFAGAREWCADHPDLVGAAYTPSKLAVAIWTADACHALGARGIRINCTLPGPTETPMLPDFKNKMRDGFWDEYPIPLGRFQRPEEQARAMVFINSRAAAGITGTALLVDGGTAGAAATGRITIPPMQRREDG
jgi:NAD(P)-dependent dehydrogenase (short-subunit alcohol dehydrogenase family)